MNPTIAEKILGGRRIAYAVTDCALRIVEMHDATGVLGCHVGDVRAAGLLDLLPELAGSENVLSEVLSGQLRGFRLPLLNREAPEGETCYLTVEIDAYSGQSGEIDGLLYVAEDVTESALLEQRLVQHQNELRLLRDRLARQNLELAAANLELRHLDQIKSVFVSVAAHELRTPLTSVAGYVEMMLNGDYGAVTAEQRDVLQVVHGSAQRLVAVTNDLLDITRIEAGRLELLLTPVDLPALLRQVAAEFAPQIERKQQVLEVRCDAGIPPVLCDRVRVAQIAGNLLSNANKYSPQGGAIVLSLGRAAEEGFALLTVADSGLGIASEDQAVLFTRFFRGSSALAAAVAGAGLGLSIARSLVELHGGRIWFESRPGQGSTFYVTLPVAGSDPVSPEGAGIAYATGRSHSRDAWSQ